MMQLVSCEAFVPERTIEKIEGEIIALRDQTAQNMIAIGKKLTEAKGMMPHGSWKDWLQNNVQFSYRTAARLMQVAERFGDVPTVAHLEVSKIYALLDVPEDALEGFVEGHDVEGMSTRELQAAIAARKEAEKRAEDLQRQLDEVSQDEEAALAAMRETVQAEAQQAIQAEGDRMRGQMQRLQEEAGRARAEAYQYKRQLDAIPKDAKAGKPTPEAQELQRKLDDAKRDADRYKGDYKRIEALLNATKAVQEKQPIPLKNDAQRAAFLATWADWPLVCEVPQLGSKHYRYELPDGSAIWASLYKGHAHTSWNGEERNRAWLTHIEAGADFKAGEMSESVLIGYLTAFKEI